MSDSVFPRDLERFDLTDLTKGMVTTVPSASMPEGSFRELKDMYSTLMGPQRRDSWRVFFPTKEDYARIPVDLVSGENVTDLEGFFDANNRLQLLAFSSKRLYVNALGDEFLPVYWGGSPYTITGVSGQQVNCSGATFVTDRVLVGDVAVFEVAGERVEAAITGVNSETQILVDAVPVGHASNLNIVREFQNPYEDMVDYTFMPKAIVVVDGSDRGIWKYNGVNLVDMKVTGDSADIAAGNGSYLKGASTCLFFNGYLYLGNTIERYADPTQDNALDQKRTVRWSSVTQVNEFATNDYVIFTKEMSNVLKLTSIDECPFVFLGNAMYYGTASSLEGLPYAFTRIEMGAISAVGKRAMCSVPGGIVFIAQKNVYFVQLGVQGSRVPSITPIANAIFNKACYESMDFKFERAFFSPQQNMLYCAFPKTKRRLGRLFCLSFDTKTWSYVDDESSRFVSANVFPYFQLLRWQDMDATPWSALDESSWFSLKLEDYTSRVFVVDTSGYVYVADNAANWDETIGQSGIETVDYQCVVETGDMEFGSPGMYKVVTQLYMTVADVALRERTTDLEVNVQISCDRGKTWTNKTDLVFEAGTFFEDAHVRTASPTVRFRFTFGKKSALFILSELGFRIRRMGSVVQRGQ